MIRHTEVKVSIVHHIYSIGHVCSEALIFLNTVIFEYFIRLNASECELRLCKAYVFTSKL